MLRQTILLVFFSIFIITLPVEGLYRTDIDFLSVLTCQKPIGTWCMELFYLENDWDIYNLLGVTEVNCFSERKKVQVKYTDYFLSEKNWQTRNWYHLGVRHNCTHDGSLIDWISIEIAYFKTTKRANVTKVSDLDDCGWVSSYQNGLAWDTDRFQGKELKPKRIN